MRTQVLFSLLKPLQQIVKAARYILYCSFYLSICIFMYLVFGIYLVSVLASQIRIGYEWTSEVKENCKPSPLLGIKPK